MSDKYTKSARGQSCLVRIAGVCNFDSTTTVFAHLNGGGWGMKENSISGAYACSACHFWLDGGYVKSATRIERDLAHLEGMKRTQDSMIINGILVL